VDGDTFEYLMESVMLDACSATPLYRRVDGADVGERNEFHDVDGYDADNGNNDDVAQDKDSQMPLSTTTRIEYAIQSHDRGKKYKEWMASHLDSAEVILLIAQQQQQLRKEDGGLVIKMSPFLLHNYVKSLCLAGEVDRAMDVLNDILYHHHCTPPPTTSENADTDVDVNDSDDGDENTPIRHNWTDISLDTFTFLSSTFIQLGDIEKVNDVLDMCRSAGYDDGLPLYTMERIEALKRRRAREGI